MKTSISAYPRLSLGQTAACGAALAVLLTLGACGKKADSAAPAAGGGAAPAAAGAKPKTTLTLAGLQADYKATIDNGSADPMDKKVAAFVAKVGVAPAADDGRVKTWYALDGDNCSKVDIDGKDGSIANGTTDKANCGM